MRRNLSLVFIATFTLLFVSGCMDISNISKKDENSSSDKMVVKFQIRVVEWSGWGKGWTKEVSNQIVEVKEGEQFGPKNIIPFIEEKPPFKLIKIIDSSNAQISMEEGYSASGSLYSEKTADISTEESKINTTTTDEGLSIYIKIAK